MMWNDYGPGGWFMGGPIFLIVAMALCVVVMFFMMRRRDNGSGDAAAQILKERYARGEIDKAEYEERRRTLES